MRCPFCLREVKQNIERTEWCYAVTIKCIHCNLSVWMNYKLNESLMNIEEKSKSFWMKWEDNGKLIEGGS